MAIQTLSRPSFASSLGGQIGQGLGTGLGSGLQVLAQNKLNQLADREAQNRISTKLNQLGLTPAESNFIATLPAAQQWDALREFFQGSGSSQPDQFQQLPAGVPQQYQEPSPAQEEIKTLSQELQSLGGGYTGNLANQISPQNLLGSYAVQQPQIQQSQLANVPAAQNAPAANKITKSLAQAVKNNTSVKNIAKTDKELNQEQQRAEKKQAAIRTRNAPALEDLSKKEQTFKNILPKIYRLKELNDTRKVGEQFLIPKGLQPHVPTDWLNKETQEFNSLAIDVATALENAGGSTSDTRTKLRQESKPSSTQSIEARTNLINSLIKDAESTIKKGNARDEILIENEGNEPLDFLRQIEKRAHKGSKNEDFSNNYDWLHPEEWEEGSVLAFNGKPFKMVNNQWQPLNSKGS